MIEFMLASLLLVDILLVFAFVRLSKRQLAHQSLMVALTEERSLLNDLRSSVRDDLATTQSQVRAMKEQVQLLATEAEQEVSEGVARITGEVDGIITQLSARFDGPMEEMTEKQHYLEKLVQRIQAERKALSRVTEKAESLTKFFKEGVKFDEVVKELEDKKFSDIRALVAQGVGHTRIARELGVSEQEVKLIAGIG